MLTVEPHGPAEARQGALGRVLLHPRVMAQIGVSMGEPILLRLSSAPEKRDIGSVAWRDFQHALAERSPGVAVGIVWPAAQAREKVVLLSATLRTNIGAGLGDQVEAWPVESARRDGSLRVLPASSVVLELRKPAPSSAALQLPVAGTLHSYLRAQLQGQYVLPGNEIIVPLLGEKRVVIVTEVQSQLKPAATTIVGDQLPALYLIGAGTDLQISAGDVGTPSREAWSASPIDSNVAANTEVEPNADPEPDPEPEPESPAQLRSEAAPPVVGGLEPQLASVRELLNVALHTPLQMEQLGLRPPTGVLLHGPPGTGKTLIARRLAAECGDEVAFVSIDGAEIVGKYVGESEARLRDIFHAAANTPSGKTIIFVDEIDALAPSREKGGAGGSELHNRIVATFLTLLDGVKPSAEEIGNSTPAPHTVGKIQRVEAGTVGRIFVIAATNRPDALDEALRRPGRLDREVEVGVPSLDTRKQILEAILTTVPHSISPAAVAKLAADSHGFTGADLSLLVKEATVLAVRRLLRERDSAASPNASRKEANSGLAAQVDALVEFYSDPAVGGAKTVEQCQSILLKRIGLGERGTDAQNVGLSQAEWSTLCGKLQTKYPAAKLVPAVFEQNQIEADDGDGESNRAAMVDCSSLVVREEDAIGAIGVVRPSSMREVALEIPSVLWSDIGGGADLQQQLREAVEWPLSHPEAFTRMGIRPPRGVLLYGPPGCSKTLTARALATESKLNFIAVKGPELFSKWVGESEKAIRDIYRKARAASPAIVFFDEIDALATQRGASGSASVGDRVLSQLLTELDGIVGSAGAGGELSSAVVTIAATNRPDLLDAALVRPGRFDRQVYVGPPDLDARRDILKIGLRDIPTAPGIDLAHLALRSEGYSGAEMAALCREAAMSALTNAVSKAEAEAIKLSSPQPAGSVLVEDTEAGVAVARAADLRVGPENFDEAFRVVKPSITAEQREFYRRYADSRR